MAMRVLALVLGVAFCLAVALDAFQTIILPRRPRGRFRITRLFYLITWTPWAAVADRIGARKVREQAYSTFGPLSLIFLLVVWAGLLIAGFGLIYFSMGTPLGDPLHAATDLPGWLVLLRRDIYFSATTLFTLGLGDVTPQTHWARAMAAVQAGTGLGFVALVIGYLPVIYQAFSRREVSVAMLDARAGSPPTSTELLRRHGFEGGQTELIALLSEWERWSADILESHISYPILCYYRSQHDNQSWLAGLVTILDACALLITTIPEDTGAPSVRQAQLTFAIGRHALIDLGHVFQIEHRAVPEQAPDEDRLPAQRFDRLCDALGEMQMRLCGDPETMRRLTAIRTLYEPHAQSLSEFLRMPLPLWVAEETAKADSWKTVSGLRVAGGITPRPLHVSDRAAALHLHDEEHGY